MDLRLLLWRRHIGALALHVPCVRAYEASEEWCNFEIVLQHDWARRPPGSTVQYHDLRWVLLRQSLLMRYWGYIQGYVYIALPLLTVLRNRREALYATINVLGATACFSPVGHELGYQQHRRLVVQRIFASALTLAPRSRVALHLLWRATAICDNMCLKFLFIVFGQNFEFDALLHVWDFVLPDLLNGFQQRLMAVATALLVRFVRQHEAMYEPNEYSELLFSGDALGLCSAAEVLCLASRAYKTVCSAQAHHAFSVPGSRLCRYPYRTRID